MHTEQYNTDMKSINTHYISCNFKQSNKLILINITMLIYYTYFVVSYNSYMYVNRDSPGQVVYKQLVVHKRW